MAEKRDLARAGTIEITSKEGKAFLEKNLTEWKKPLLMDQFEDDQEAESSKKATKRGRPAKNSSAKTKKGKGQSSSPKKKARLSKATTMVATAKEGAQLLGNENLGDTRQMTTIVKKTVRTMPKRTTTMVKTVQEAKAVYGSSPQQKRRSSGKKATPAAAAKKSPKKPPAKKAKKSPLKKAGTMAVTAKAGKAYLKKNPPKGILRTK